MKNMTQRYTLVAEFDALDKLDNNVGALFRILDDAEESECKESLLAYHFLLLKGGPVSAEELDQSIEAWFAQTLQCRIDFEIDDALDKLLTLNLATNNDDQWQAVIQTAEKT